jgi:hypothetical protein
LNTHTLAQTAAALTAQGLTDGAGRPFTSDRVRYHCFHYKIPTRVERLHARGLQSLTDTAARLGVHPCTVKRWRELGLLTAKLGPGSLQSWAPKIIKVLGEAHDHVQAAQADGHTVLDPQVLADLCARYDATVTLGIVHNRHRDWHDGNHPGYALATWLNKHADQVWLFTTNFAVDWTSNAAERGVKPAKRHQAVSGYWQNDQTLARWCLINSYLTTARNHGLTILDAITRALTDKPWLPVPITA